MATMESMLRNINRQLEQHARIFGLESETYKEFVHEIERELGKANYTQRNGAVGYSRSIPMPYKYEDVLKANNKSKGRHTAAMKWSKAAQESKGKNKEEIKRWRKIQDKIEKNFEAIYNYLQDEFGEKFYSTEFSRLSPDTFDDSILKHIQNTTQYKTLEEIEKLIDKAVAKMENMKKEIEEDAKQTHTSRHMTKKEIEQITKKGKKWKK